MQSTMRGITLRVSSTIMERCANLFCSLRNELTTEDLKRNAAVLHNSPAINMLIPYTLANLDTLKDTKVYFIFFRFLITVIMFAIILSMTIKNTFAIFESIGKISRTHFPKSLFVASSVLNFPNYLYFRYNLRDHH